MREEASFRKLLKKVRASKQKLEIDDQQVVDEKKKKKETIQIISSLNKSRKLLVSEVLRLVKLILLVPSTNAISERSRSTLCRVKTYLRSSMTQEPVTSSLVVTAYKLTKSK